jgi:regulator of protease activity HflC (stomatin/prohibitin superfamily)
MRSEIGKIKLDRLF